MMNEEAIWQFLSTRGADFGLKILAAIAAWVIGRRLISLTLRAFPAALERGKRIDSTLATCLRSSLSVLLNLVLILAILDIFGVKTTSFAALTTPDNVHTLVGNNTVFSSQIQNCSALPHRRVDCLAKVDNSVDPLARLRATIMAIPNVTVPPAPDIEIQQFTPRRPAAVCASRLPHRPPLAGLLRQPQGHRRDLRRRGHLVPVTPISSRTR